MSCLSWWLLHFGEISPSVCVSAMMLVVVEPPYGVLTPVVSRKAAPHTVTVTQVQAETVITVSTKHRNL